jgi:hypothetical protein
MVPPPTKADPAYGAANWSSGRRPTAVPFAFLPISTNGFGDRAPQAQPVLCSVLIGEVVLAHPAACRKCQGLACRGDDLIDAASPRSWKRFDEGALKNSPEEVDESAKSCIFCALPKLSITGSKPPNGALTNQRRIALASPPQPRRSFPRVIG